MKKKKKQDKPSSKLKKIIGVVNSITGTLNQISANTSTGNIQLSLPQSIATSSSPTFATVTHSTSGVFNGSTSGSVTVQAPAAAGTTTVTLPGATGTLATLAGTETLTNKTISGSSNTLSNIANSSLTNSSVTVTAGTGMSGGGSFTLNQSGTSTITLNSTITQYTDALARSAISLTTGSSTNGGALSYNSSTGAFTFQPATAYTLPTATTSVLGGVKVDGTTITISSGTISATAYTLPTASGSTLGGVKVGTGLSIDGSGVLSASGSPTFTNITTTGQIIESFTSYSTSISSGGTATLNCTTGNIWNITSTVSGNWTAALTNLAITTGQATNVTLIITQGATAYIPTALTVNSTSVTINWQGGTAPTGNASKKDVIAFSILQTGASTYLVFGQLVTFG